MFKKVIKTLLVLLLLGVGALYFILPPVNIPLIKMLQGAEADQELLDQRVMVPEDFGVTLFATGIKGARFMRETAKGDILLSSSSSGDVYVLYRDEDGDGVSDGQHVLLSGLKSPHGLELDGETLFIADTDAIYATSYNADERQAASKLRPVITDLPNEGNHSKKTVRLGADGWLYFNVGSSCNACIEEDERYATIMRVRPDGSDVQIYATGVRNSEGFDWSPRDGALYAVDNGRDLLGDDYPVEELNQIVEGGFYGWPYVNGFGDLDPDVGDQGGDLIARAIDPVYGMRAHNAPLGMTFLRNGRYPEAFQHDALVALHGSWNRSEKDGYSVVRLSWDEDGTITESDFMTGFLKDGDVIGRPVDVLEASDGAIYVSDDLTGSVYRVAYGEDGMAIVAASGEEAIIPIADRETFSADAIQRGQDLYETRACVGCHGALGEDGVQVPLINLAERRTQADIIETLSSPPSSMPRIPLSDEELQDMSAYLLGTLASANE